MKTLYEHAVAIKEKDIDFSKGHHVTYLKDSAHSLFPSCCYWLLGWILKRPSGEHRNVKMQRNIVSIINALVEGKGREPKILCFSQYSWTCILFAVMHV